MSFPVNGVLDDFNRGDESPLAGNWDGPTKVGNSELKLVSNRAAPGSGSISQSWYTAATYGPDCEVYATISVKPGTGDGFGVWARIQSPGTSGLDVYNFVAWDRSGTDEYNYYRADNGVFTQLGSTIVGPEFSAGDGIGLEISGSTLTGYRRSSGVWSAFATRTDSTYPDEGYLGLEISGGNGPGRLDDFGGGTLGGEDTSVSVEARSTLEASPFVPIHYGSLESQGVSGIEIGALAAGAPPIWTPVFDRQPDLHVYVLPLGRDVGIDITPYVGNLRFSTAAVGGFASATFDVLGDPADWKRRVPYLSTLTITYGPSIAWEGRVEDIGSFWSGAEVSTSFAALGARSLLAEASVHRIWTLRDIKWEQAPGTTLGSYKLRREKFNMSTGQFDDTDLSLIGVEVRGNDVAVVNNDSQFARYLVPGGLTLKRIMGIFDINGSASFRGQIRDQAGDVVNYTADQASISQALSDSTILYLGGRATGSVTLTDTDYIRFYDLRLLGTTLTEDVAGGFYGGSIIRDLIALVPGITAGQIEDGSDYTIKEMEAATRDTVLSKIEDADRFYEREWAIWEGGRLDWRAIDLREPHWVVYLDELESLRLDGSVDELVRTTYILYRDSGSGRETEVSSASTEQLNPYVKHGLTKDDIVPYPEEAATATEATQLATRLTQLRGKHPPAGGQIQIAADRYVRSARGSMVPAWLIRGGDNIAIPDIPATEPLGFSQEGESTFHIVATSADLERGLVTITLEGFGRERDVTLARLAAATREATAPKPKPPKKKSKKKKKR